MADFNPTKLLKNRLGSQYHFVFFEGNIHMTKGILCTIDFSESSKEALKWAIKFARDMGYDLTILYTYRLTKNISEEVVVWKKRMEEEAQKKFAAFESEFLTDPGVKYEFKVEVGFVTDRVEDHARKSKIHFLVVDKSMCTRSRDIFDDLVEHIASPLIII